MLLLWLLLFIYSLGVCIKTTYRFEIYPSATAHLTKGDLQQVIDCLRHLPLQKCYWQILCLETLTMRQNVIQAPKPTILGALEIDLLKKMLESKNSKSPRIGGFRGPPRSLLCSEIICR